MRILREIVKSENGAVPIIEMTLVFPFVLIVLGFLIYLGSYVLQSVAIYNDAQIIAVAAGREGAIPGYEYLYENRGITTKADFNYSAGELPATGTIINMMSVHQPYRYWGNSFLKESEKADLEQSLEKLVADTSFLAPSNVDCTITTTNYIVSQEVKVNVVKIVVPPTLFEYIGIKDNMNINITATAVVSDPAEFIRNTDMVFELGEKLAERTGLNKKIASFKQKFKDITAKLGISW